MVLQITKARVETRDLSKNQLTACSREIRSPVIHHVGAL